MGGVEISFRPVILHIDMDAFFAAVEIRNNPKLRGKPVIVGGGVGNRGVVSTCSYEARKFGVKSGMPAGKARRLCPQGIFISNGLYGYVYASAMLQKILEKYTPIVEPFSVDEAFMDITGMDKHWGGYITLIETMKREIWDKLHLTGSIGVAPSKYLAKLASGVEKPNGLTVMDRSRFQELFFPRSVNDLWGIGDSTTRSLNRRGIFTVRDLAAAEPGFLRRVFGKSGTTLSVMARGRDESEVFRYRDMPHDKSMSHETTLGEDLQDPCSIRSTILWLSDKVARRMRKWGYIGKTVSVKVRSSDFRTITRARTLPEFTDRCDVVYHHALRLVPKEYGMKFHVRLLGVRVSNLQKIRETSDDDKILSNSHLVDNQTELDLDGHDGEYISMTHAVDAIRDKFGESSISLAGTLL